MGFADAVKAILERVGDFFDIFDLSFFVSGALLFAAVTFMVTLADDYGPDPRRTDLVLAVDQAEARFAEAERALAEATAVWREERDLALSAKLDTLRREQLASLRESREALLASQRAVAVLESDQPVIVRFARKTTAPLAVLGIYILGLLCFATGRLWLRRSTLAEELSRALGRHGLDEVEPLAGYRERKAWVELYTWLWVWLRESERRESFKLLRRFWVMTAVYDGVAVALLLWALLAWFGVPPGLLPVGIAASALLVGLAWLCKREAGRYYCYQVHEIVATYAHAHAPGVGAPGVTVTAESVVAASSVSIEEGGAGDDMSDALDALDELNADLDVLNADAE